MRAPRDARPDAAADQAAHDVLAALYPSMRGQLGTMLHAELAKIPGGRGRHDGTQVGATVARHLLQLRAHDGSAATPPPFVEREPAGSVPAHAARFPRSGVHQLG